MENQNFNTPNNNIPDNNKFNPQPLRPEKPKNRLPLRITLSIILIISLALLGYSIYQQISKQQTKIENKSEIVDETKDWKTYTNDQYGFELKYPTNGDFEVQKDGSVIINQGNYGNIVVNIPRVFGTPNYSNTFQDLKARFSGKGYIESEIIIGGIQSIKVSSPQIGDIVYVPLSDNKILEIDGNFKNPQFNQMLPTFKFIDSTARPQIIITSPNGGEVWKIGEKHNITWTAANFKQGPNVCI